MRELAIFMFYKRLQKSKSNIKINHVDLYQSFKAIHRTERAELAVYS